METRGLWHTKKRVVLLILVLFSILFVISRLSDNKESVEVPLPKATSLESNYDIVSKCYVMLLCFITT